MNVTTVYELFSVIMQETFQHNSDFSITYKTNIYRFTQMQVGKVKYLYMIQNYIGDCALHQKNDSYNMKISDPLKLCAIIDTNNQNIYFMDFDFNWGFVLTQDQRLPARSMLFSEYINKTLKDIQNNIIKKYMDELDLSGNRKKECDELIEACPDDYKLIKSALIGICYYAAVRMLKKTEQPVVGIVIKTTVRMKEDLNFLYKWVSEDMGPADTYCPDNILDELSEADSDWAKNWRAECRKCNERKQKLSAMPVGSEIKVPCDGFEYIMTKTVLPSHSTPQWINFEENFKFTVDDIVQSGFSCIDLEKSEENKMEHITKIWKYIFTFDKKGEITFESTGALECKECLKTIKLKDQISWESMLRKDKIGTVICNMPTEKEAFAHFTYYYVYLTEDNPMYAISLIQKKMEDRVDFLQKETSRLNLNIQSLNKKIILLNEEKLEKHDKN